MHAVNHTLALGGLILAGVAQASTVRYETGTSFGPDQPSAAAYRAAVELALAQPGAHSALVPAWDNLSSQALFGGFNNNIASRVTVQFAATAGQAGLWGLRIGGDFGYGAAVFLDGVALGFSSLPMEWASSWADPTQSFQFGAVPITPGNHTLVLYGLENCCDGGQQGQFSIGGAAYRSFGSADGLATVVPEPAVQALLLTGLGGLAWRLQWLRRRSRTFPARGQ